MYLDAQTVNLTLICAIIWYIARKMTISSKIASAADHLRRRRLSSDCSAEKSDHTTIDRLTSRESLIHVTKCINLQSDKAYCLGR